MFHKLTENHSYRQLFSQCSKHSQSLQKNTVALWYLVQCIIAEGTAWSRYEVSVQVFSLMSTVIILSKYFGQPLKARRHTEPTDLSFQHQTVLGHCWRKGYHSSVGSTTRLSPKIYHHAWPVMLLFFHVATMKYSKVICYWPLHSCWGMLLWPIEMLK